MGPPSTPADLGDRLVRRGLYREDGPTMWGMGLEDRSRPFAAPTTVRVERSTGHAADASMDMMALVWVGRDAGEPARI